MDIYKLQKLGLKITSITDHIHVVQGKLRSRSPFSNSILVLDKVNAIIDTGCGIELIRRLKSALHIDLVINSHSHPDHTSGNWLFQEEGSPDIIVPANNKDSICNADKLAPRLIGKTLSQLWKDTHLKFTGFRDFSITSSFEEGDEFDMGFTRFVALYTPGHLNDHYCLWEPVEKILIGFDIDLSPFGPWYGNEESDIDAFKASIKRVKGFPIDVFISSHARPIKAAYFSRRMASYKAAFDHRDEVILDLVPGDGWVALEDIVRGSPIYGYDYTVEDKILFYGEKNMVKKHLEGLVHRGRVLLVDGKYRQKFG